MNQSHDFSPATSFTAGAVGEPGHRVFYLQVGDHFDTVSVKLEKQQVGALAQLLEGLVSDLPEPTGTYATPGFREPPHPDWVVGQIAVGVEEGDGAARLIIVIDELVPEDPEPEFDPDFDADFETEFSTELNTGFDSGFDADSGPSDDADELNALFGLDEPTGANIRAQISVEQAVAFIDQAKGLMSKGRPPCRLCGQPLDPVGHFCPRLN